MGAITLDELLRALEEAQEGKGEGYTVSELCEAHPGHSLNRDKVRFLIKRAIRRKLVRVSRKTISDISGREVSVPSYVLVKHRPHRDGRRDV